MKIQIKNRFSLDVMFESNTLSLTQLVEENKKNLERADLRGANLERADLRDANLERADLERADLERADLEGANLRDADLRDADLRGADLRGANLERADLRGANLERADLRDANLGDANLGGANLGGADLESLNFYINNCKRDILNIFHYLPNEVVTLRQKIIEGKIDGTQYSGDCCCLIGTLGDEKACSAIPYYEKGLHNFGEQLFYQIREGDTPENNQFSKIALELCDEFLEKLK